MLVQEMTVKAWKKDRKTSPRLRSIYEVFLEHLNLLFACVRCIQVLIFLIITRSLKVYTTKLCVIVSLVQLMFAWFRSKTFQQNETFSLFFLSSKRVSSFFSGRPVGLRPRRRTGNQEIYRRAAKHAAESVGVAPDSNKLGLEASSKHRQRKEET